MLMKVILLYKLFRIVPVLKKVTFYIFTFFVVCPNGFVYSLSNLSFPTVKTVCY